jgi:hypothetical protein
MQTAAANVGRSCTSLRAASFSSICVRATELAASSGVGGNPAVAGRKPELSYMRSKTARSQDQYLCHIDSGVECRPLMPRNRLQQASRRLQRRLHQHGSKVHALPLVQGLLT